ncbi:MAG TPA: hypothetical protein VLM41_06690, partial [Steroidobacteraceae bacterium]|nr:hypothetical protein [Steroidobacteraceae bacterium]
GLAASTRIIASEDDPIIPAGDLARLARAPSLSITRTRYGGHCGYYSGGEESWLAREIIETLGPA